MNHCDECGLDYEYDEKYHQCRKGPVVLAGSYLDEVKRLQGISTWKEER